MSEIHLLHLRRLCRWGAVLAVLICALPNNLQAQRRRGRPPIDLPLAPDPTDPERQIAAAHRKATRYFEEGRRLIEKNKIKQAKKKFKAVIGLVGLEGVGQSAFNELMGIHQQGMEALKRVQTLYKDEKYRDALKLAKETRALYANLWVGVEAASGAPNIARRAVKFIELIESNPAAQIEIQEYEASRRFKKISRLEKRAKKDPAGYLDLYKALKSISSRFPDCPTGKQCSRQLAKLKADKKTWKLIRREKERRYIASVLAGVEQFEKAGLMAKASEEYRKLTKKYPGKSRKEFKKMAEK